MFFKKLHILSGGFFLKRYSPGEFTRKEKMFVEMIRIR